jgi:hypothetical protein
VRAVVDDLAGVGSEQALIERWAAAGDLVGAAAGRTGVALESLAVEQVAGAAFSLRDAALRAEGARSARLRLLQEARENGAEWVVLHETGQLGAGLASPYGLTRMHVPTGVAIVAAVQPDPTTGGALHMLTVVRLDPESGDLVDDDPGLADTAYVDAASFGGAEQALVAVVENHAHKGRIG